MTETLKDIALRVADSLNEVKQAGESFAARDKVIDDYAIEFAARLVEELGKQEAVAKIRKIDSGQVPTVTWYGPYPPIGSELYAAPVTTATAKSSEWRDVVTENEDD